MPKDMFLCGYRPDRMKTLDELEPGERKVIRNFSQFLGGQGHRCPICLHKAKKHELRCGAKGCDCTLSNSDVHAVRKQTGAR